VVATFNVAAVRVPKTLGQAMSLQLRRHPVRQTLGEIGWHRWVRRIEGWHCLVAILAAKNALEQNSGRGLGRVDDL